MLNNREVSVSNDGEKPEKTVDSKKSKLAAESGFTADRNDKTNDEGDTSMKLTGIIEPAPIDYLYAEDASGVSEDGLDSEDLYDSMPELGEEFHFYGSLFPPEDIFRMD